MSTDAITAHLDQLDRLDQQRRMIKAAPQPIEAQLAKARAEFDAAAAAFKAAPWSQQAGIRGAMAVLLPKETARFELDQIRQRAAADPREPLSDAERHHRLRETDAELQKVLTGLGPDDLALLERERAAAHAALRGLTQRRDEIAARCDRRANAISQLAEERQQHGAAPLGSRISYWQGERPAFGPPSNAPLAGAAVPATKPPGAAPTQAERAEAEAAIARQLDDDAAQLARDQVDLAAAEGECAEAARAWRRAADLALRCERWLQRKPTAQAPAAMPAAAE